MAQRSLDDPYSDDILESIPAHIRYTLNSEQRVAIKEALVRRGHGVDLRFVLPLLFTQIYVVLLIGKDRRYGTHSVMYERRVAMKRVSLATLLAILGILALLAALWGMYAAKSASGVDIMPRAHLKDALRQIGV